LEDGYSTDNVFVNSAPHNNRRKYKMQAEIAEITKILEKLANAGGFV